jgi:type I site-specific restriction endonuclease
MQDPLTTELRLRDNKGRTEVFDIVRKRYVNLSREEWVRQHFIRYLVNDRKIPVSLISVEASLTYNGLKKRSDIVAYDASGRPRMIVECKAPEVGLTQDVFDQVALYNMTLDVPFLVVTNGVQHFACRIDRRNSSYEFLKEVPDFTMLSGNE